MNQKPQCIIVTGRPGAGKSTLAQKLARQLWLPLLSRDEIKEGYVNTFSVRHDQLPKATNAIVTNIFFDFAMQYLRAQVSVVIEAAFQHAIWQNQMPRFLEISRPMFVICALDAEIAAQRHLQRGLNEEKREWYHGDARVQIYRETGEIAPPSEYVAPHFGVPTIQVSTQNDYAPDLEAIARQIQLQNAAASTCGGV